MKTLRILVALCLLVTLAFSTVSAYAEVSDATITTLLRQGMAMTAQILQGAAEVRESPYFSTNDKSYQKACKYLLKLDPNAKPVKALLVPADEDMLLDIIASAFPVPPVKESLYQMLPFFVQTFVGAATTQKLASYPQLVSYLLPTVKMEPLDDITDRMLLFLVYSQDVTLTLFTSEEGGLTAQAGIILGRKKQLAAFDLSFAQEYAKNRMGLDLPTDSIYLDGAAIDALLP